MEKTATVLQVFVASPGDVGDERRILEDVVNEFNVTWGNANSVRLELIKWETHTRPGFGLDPQDVINRQIGDKYDIFLGIMWGRFGTPTNRAESGIEEEFLRAYERLKTSAANDIQIMFYFKEAGIAPSQMNVEQLAKLQSFKSKIGSEFGGLYHEFETTDDFQTKIRIHLNLLVQDWLKSASVSSIETKTTSDASESDPLRNLAALTAVEDEEGIIELSERATEAMEKVNGIVQKMTSATEDLGSKFNQRTAEIQEIAKKGSPDLKSAKRFSNYAADDLETYVKRMSVEIPEFHNQHTLSMEAFEKIALIADKDHNENAEDISAALAQIQNYRTSMSTSASTSAQFRDAIAGLPRMTTSLNRARKRAVAILDDLLAQFKRAENQTEDVELLLERMIESAESKGT